MFSQSVKRTVNRLPLLIIVISIGILFPVVSNAEDAIAKLASKQIGTFEKRIINYIKDFPTGPDITSPELQFRLGMLYLEGKGLPKSVFSALIWVEKAANNKFPAAQYTLGILYRDGTQVKQNDILAHKWLSRAARGGFANAQIALSKFNK